MSRAIVVALGSLVLHFFLKLLLLPFCELLLQPFIVFNVSMLILVLLLLSRRRWRSTFFDVFSLSVVDLVDSIRALPAEEEDIQDANDQESYSENHGESSIFVEVVEESHRDEDNEHATASLRIQEVEKLPDKDYFLQFCQKEQNGKEELKGSHEDNDHGLLCIDI